MRPEHTTTDQAARDELEDRVRHALTYLDETRRTLEQALDLLARREHEAECEHEQAVVVLR
jgi:hypothetical protein